MFSIITKSVVVFILNLFLISQVLCDVKPLETGKNYHHYKTLIFVTLGYPFASSSSEFFETYNGILGGNTHNLDVPANLGGGIKIKLLENYRFGFQAEYLISTIKETYQQVVSAKDGTSFARSFYQEFYFNSIPLLFSAEYIPIEKQFRTYTGFLCGIVVGNYKWIESINSENKYDKRKSGTHFDNRVISPAIGLYAGMDLGFDKKSGSMFLGSFFIETSYLLFIKSIDIFKNISNQYQEVPTQIMDYYNPFPGCLSIKVGISFNLVGD